MTNRDTEYKRVMIVVRRLNMGGIEKASLTLAKAMCDAGCDVHLMVLKGEPSLEVPPRIRLHQFDIEQQSRKKTINSIVNLFGRLIFRFVIPGSSFLWQGWGCGHILAQKVCELENKYGKFDLILLRGQGVFESLWRYIDPRCWLVVEGPPAGIGKYFFAKKLYEKLYSNKNIVTVSDGIWQVLKSELERYEITPRKQATIYNALDVSTIKKMADMSVSDLPKGMYLLHVARLSAIKNQELLIKAYHYSKVNLPLIIIGDGDKKKSLQALVLALKLESRVIFLGARQNPYPYMKHATALILSSKQEGLGLVLVESLICGTQVVATDVPGGIREILIAEQARLLATNTIDGLATKINEAITNPITVNPEWIDKFESRKIISQFLSLNHGGI